MMTNLIESICSDFEDTKRYMELSAIQSQDLLTFEEQEEYIAISTRKLYRMMKEAYGNDVMC